MASLTIHDIDDAASRSWREQAERHGRSIEEEARAILGQALPPPPFGAVPDSLYDAFRAIVAEVGPIELGPMPRMPWREPPDFDA